MIMKGQKINDRYQIMKTIGEGGMANVYLAYDTILDRNVAVKVLRGDLSGDDIGKQEVIPYYGRTCNRVDAFHPSAERVFRLRRCASSDVFQKNEVQKCGHFYVTVHFHRFSAYVLQLVLHRKSDAFPAGCLFFHSRTI